MALIYAKVCVISKKKIRTRGSGERKPKLFYSNNMGIEYYYPLLLLLAILNSQVEIVNGAVLGLHISIKRPCTS